MAKVKEISEKQVINIDVKDIEKVKKFRSDYAEITARLGEIEVELINAGVVLDNIKDVIVEPNRRVLMPNLVYAREELKKIGGVKPPKEFVFMDRAAVGLGSVFMHLRAEVNWYRVFHELIDNFDQKKLTEKQQSTLKLVNL